MRSKIIDETKSKISFFLKLFQILIYCERVCGQVTNVFIKHQILNQCLLLTINNMQQMHDISFHKTILQE